MRWVAVIALCALACGDEGAPAREATPATPPSGEIVYAAGGDGGVTLRALSPATGRSRRLAAAAGADLVPLAAEPLVAVAVRREHGAAAEQLVVIEDGALRPLTPPAGTLRAASWAPDGSYLVFSSDHQSFRDLYRLDTKSGAVERLTDDPEGNFEPAVSPRGDRVAFVSSRDGNTEIYGMRPDGSEVARLTAFHKDDWSPRWSPHGEHIAFMSDREGSDRVFVMRADGTEQRRLTPSADPAEREADIAWSPDGGRIAYAVRGPGGASAVWVADLDSGRFALVSPAGARDAEPSWSPDGRHLVVSSIAAGEDEPDLVLVRADGTGRTRLTDTAGPEFRPRWVP